MLYAVGQSVFLIDLEPHGKARNKNNISNNSNDSNNSKNSNNSNNNHNTNSNTKNSINTHRIASCPKLYTVTPGPRSLGFAQLASHSESFCSSSAVGKALLAVVQGVRFSFCGFRLRV